MSMESLSKNKKKNLPKNIKEMSTEMLQEALKKRRECNSIAVQIVEKLCDEHIDEEWFLENLQYINQCHFDDVTVERSILKLCGYPLCDEQLTNIPAQQYHISTKFNQVFDITERKNFCSGNCYKSAMYVKNQLFTSPLWFRDQEKIPKYKLLKSSKSIADEKMIFTTEKVEESENIIKNASLEKCVNINERINKLTEQCFNLMIQDSIERSPKISEINISRGGGTSDKKNRKINEVKAKTNKKSECKQKDKTLNEAPSENIFLENSINKKQDRTEKTKTDVKIEDEPLSGIRKIEKSIFEWFSLDTLFYLHEDEKLKELFQDKAFEIKKVLKSKLSMSSHNEKIDKMVQLFGLFDTNLFNGTDIKTNLKPLPSYSFLKEEGRNFEIKVRAFYQGQLVIKPPNEEEPKIKGEDKTDSDLMYMPLVDSHAQIALRKKIILDKLNRVLPELIRVFSSSYVLKMDEVRNLISTFTLAAHNITFKPSEWYLIGIIMIKLLCLIDKQLESIMELESSKSQILIILRSYKLEEDYLDNLFLRIFDSVNLIRKLNDTYE